MAGANNAQLKAQGYSAKQIEKKRAKVSGPLSMSSMKGMERQGTRTSAPPAPTLKKKVEQRTQEAPKKADHGPSPLHDAKARREMASDVVNVAKGIHGEGRWGQGKIYVSSLYDAMQAKGKTRGLDMGDFKKLLVQANQEGHIRLSRADLVEVMHQGHLKRSRIDDKGANFHFVRID